MVHVVPHANQIYVKHQDIVIICDNQEVRPSDANWFVQLHQVCVLADQEGTPDYHLFQVLKILNVGEYRDLMAVQGNNGIWYLTNTLQNTS